MVRIIPLITFSRREASINTAARDIYPIKMPEVPIRFPFLSKNGGMENTCMPFMREIGIFTISPYRRHADMYFDDYGSEYQGLGWFPYVRPCG